MGSSRLAVVIGILLAAVLMLSMPVSAAADTSDSEAVEQKKAKKKVNPNKRICKKVKATGSHLTQKVCLKRRDWDEMARRAQETRRNSTGGSVGS